MCINRDCSVESAAEMLDLAEPHRDLLIGLGLDSYEEGHPPRKFTEIYARAREEGYHLTAHCDVDQTDSVSNIWECLDVLGVERIDHGVNAIEDPRLVEELVRREVGLAASPVRLNADRGPEDVDRIKQLFEAGVLVSLNTDDPAEFPSGYLANMLLEVQAASGYTKRDLVLYMANAFEMSWLSPERKTSYVRSLHDFARSRGVAMA
jgi:adenosine deaminase